MKFNWESFAPVISLLVPTLVFGFALSLDRRRRRAVERAPQVEKLLRPAGYSLSLKLDAGVDQIMTGLGVACVLSCVAGASVQAVANCIGVNAPNWPAELFGGLFLIFSGATILATIRVLRLVRELQNIRLGISGEQAVAEALVGAADGGFRAFHDLEDEKIGNIDHVAVGRRGVFLLETKARRRRRSRNGQPEHEVNYDGKALRFPSGVETKPLEQAKINAKWLSNFLEKKTGEPVRVEPLVILPGWFIRISEKGNFPVKVMNANYLVRYLEGQPQSIEPSQVKRIMAALDEKCRDVEF